MSRSECILILYTTIYREGGLKFLRAAQTMQSEKTKEFPSLNVICKPVERKSEFVFELQNNGSIKELHFIGHSGMYGIMFGSRNWPEQLSPYEWKNLKIPFASDAKAYFHACRSGRWFADFIAQTHKVKTYGYFWYTSISKDKYRFSWDALSEQDPLYIISVPGKKSHGFLGSLKKYLLRPNSFPLLEFEPQSKKVDTTYDAVSGLYDETFEDISVRADELKWLRKQIQSNLNSKPILLDIGCGTGSFLRSLSDLVTKAEGVDLSAGMIHEAKKRSQTFSNLNFSKIDGPHLPFENNSFDVVTSVLSFRYLDWDPILQEILRVLKPNGYLLVVDMVAAPLKLSEVPRFLIDKLKHKITEIRYPKYRQALHKMVQTKEWKQMLQYNPIRSEHEMKWFLQSRFPDSRVQIINYAYQSRIVAFNSAQVKSKNVAPMSFP